MAMANYVVVTEAAGSPIGKVAIIGADIDEIPSDLGSRYGSTTLELVISYTRIKCALDFFFF